MWIFSASASGKYVASDNLSAVEAQSEVTLNTQPPFPVNFEFSAAREPEN